MVLKKTRRRTTLKKTKVLSKKAKREVTTIAKRVLAKNAEHKFFISDTLETALAANSIYLLNPMGNIVLGDDNHSRIGEVINNVRLRGKFTYLHQGHKIDLPTVREWAMSKLRVMVIKTKRQITGSKTAWSDQTTALGSTATAALRDASLFYQPNGWNYPFHVALQDVRKDNDFKVLYDKVVSSSTPAFPQDLTGAIDYGTFATVKFSVRLGKFEFGEASIDYSRKEGENIYIVVCPYMPRAIAGTDLAGYISGHYSLSWTDA